MKLDVSWLLKTNDCLEMRKEIKDQENRLILKCLVCSKYEFQVCKMSANSHLPITNGVRVEGKDRLKHAVDHLNSPARHGEKLRTHMRIKCVDSILSLRNGIVSSSHLKH